jgi:hypothetical protein
MNHYSEEEVEETKYHHPSANQYKITQEPSKSKTPKILTMVIIVSVSIILTTFFLFSFEDDNDGSTQKLELEDITSNLPDDTSLNEIEEHTKEEIKEYFQGNEYSQYVEELYIIHVNATNVFENNTEMGYEEIRDFIIEFSIWSNPNKAVEEFHYYKDGAEGGELNSTAPSIWKKFEIVSNRYFYEFNINKNKDTVSIFICYSFNIYQIHASIYLDFEESVIIDIDQLNDAVFILYNDLPGWNPIIETEINAYIDEKIPPNYFLVD